MLSLQESPATLQRKLISAAGLLDLILSVTNHSSCGEERRKHGLRLGGADSPSCCFTLSYQVLARGHFMMKLEEPHHPQKDREVIPRVTEQEALHPHRTLGDVVT